MVVPTATLGPGQERGRASTSAGRTQTDATSYVGGEPAARLDERVVELRAQQRVVDRLGDVAVGQVVDGEGHGLT